MIDRAALLAACQADRELLHKLRELTAHIRIDLDSEAFDLAVDGGMPVAITDISATCHMPDVLEAPYRPAMLGELHDEAMIPIRLGGPSCLAGT